MTKTSANPRRYSRGPEGLDPNLPLNVYMLVKTDTKNLTSTYGRLEYLAEKHKNALLDIVCYKEMHGTIYLTLEVCMGPARQALRGTSIHLQAGYALLWDIIKTLFNHQPVLANPPSVEERETVKGLKNLPQLHKPLTHQEIVKAEKAKENGDDQ